MSDKTDDDKTDDKADDKADDKDDDEESITSEEQVAISQIQKVSFVKEVKEVNEVNECVVKERAIEQAKKIISNPFNFWSIFGFNPANLLVGAVANTRQEAPFQLQRRLGMEKIVTISNISGKTAYVILTPSKIKTIESVGIGAKDVSFNISFTDEGEFLPQQIPILHNTSSEYDLDNSQFYYTLFLHIDNKWLQTWTNRKINGRKYNINILERHVTLATKVGTLPEI
jgi:hypothetical protein